VGFGHKLKLATALNVARHCGRRARFRGLSSSVGGEKQVWIKGVVGNAHTPQGILILSNSQISRIGVPSRAQ
jgi:hypothetical protein